MGWGLRLASSDGSLSSQQVLHASCANRCLFLALSNGDVVRVVDDDVQVIKYVVPDGKRPIKNRVSKVFQDPNGFHGIISMENGDNWYVSLSDCQAIPMTRLKGHLIESVGWEENMREAAPPKDILIGTITGHILKASLQTLVSLRELPNRAPIVDLIIRKINGLGLNHSAIVTTPDQLFFFSGSQWEDAFAVSATAARIFDMPRATVAGTGGIQLDFDQKQGVWLTGAGTVIFKLTDEGRPGREPPIVIPFTDLVEGDTLISTLLKHPSETPKSIALTNHHILHLMSQRIHVISRVTREVVTKISINSSRYGVPKRLVTDSVGERTYLITDQRIYEVFNDNEAEKVWTLYLERHDFEQALRFCPPDCIGVVKVAQAEHLCKQGDYLTGARIFANTEGYSFEKACLRLMEYPNNERALLEYIRERLEQRGESNFGSDSIPDVMLCLWGIELALQLLDDKDKILDYFLQRATKLDIVNPVYEVLQSYGRVKELLWFAEQVGDFDTILEHYVHRQNYEEAIVQLEKHKESAGLHKYFPLLFFHEPHQVVSILVQRPVEHLDFIIPAVCLANPTSTQKGEAIRYLEYCHRMSPSVEVCHALTWLYSSGAEDNLMKFLQANERNENLDPEFALRVCHQHKHLRSEVLLYGFMGLYEEAVQLSLKRGDVALAKHNASKPNDPKVRQKLWLAIVDHLVGTKKCAGEDLLALSAESSLEIHELLPFLSDEMCVSVFRDPIIKFFERSEEEIVHLRQEMMDHRRAAALLKQDNNAASQRCITIPGDALCDICCRPATKDIFTAFACGHCIHAICGSNLGLLLDDCPLCGNSMIEAITKPFWRLPDDEEEMLSWAIDDA